MAKGFWHAGISVSDMEAALAFYRDGLGLEVESDGILPGELVRRFVPVAVDEVRSVFLAVPGTEVRIELHQYFGGDHPPVSARPGQPGHGHLCFFVEDLDALYPRLSEIGRGSLLPVVELTGGDFGGTKVVYMTDPDGYVVELVQQPPSGPRIASSTQTG
jgi:lactoylglutathione lyase